jgi:hypothetical protein
LRSIAQAFIFLFGSVFGQVGAPIPQAPMRLVPFYRSSQQTDVKAKLSSPSAIAVAQSGNVYIFDDGNSRIVKLNKQGKFVLEFGQPGSGAAQVKGAGLADSLAIDRDENVYVVDAVNPKVQKYNSNGVFLSTFRLPFPAAGIAVGSGREIFVVADTARPSDLVFVFSADGRFIRSFGKVLVKESGKLARTVNRAVIAVDQFDNVFVAFRSWPVVRKYSRDGRLIDETQYKTPSSLVNDQQAKWYSIDFFTSHPDSSFSLPLLSHSIAVSRLGKVYVLLNGHMIVAVGKDGSLVKEWAFRAPNEKDLFVGLAAGLNRGEGYFLDIHSSTVYKTPSL